MQKLPMFFLILGFFLIAGGYFVGFHFFPNKLKDKINASARLEKGSDKWKSWEVVPIPVYQQIFIFNVTNPVEVSTKGDKPILNQLGPYIYQQNRTKVDINVHLENDTITYRHHDEYYFRPDMSSGELTDKITVLNLPFLGVAAKATKMSNTERYFVLDNMKEYKEEYGEEELYISTTVDEFLFRGFYVPFMKGLAELRGEEVLPNNTFGLYYNRNATQSPKYEIYSGVSNPEKFGKVVSFNGQDKLDFWGDDEYCNVINGSDGTMIRPFMNREREFYLFVPSLCRPLKFSYNSDESYLGIPGYRFNLAPSFLQSPRTNPNNRCFCSNPGEQFENCYDDGIIDLSSCRQGSPMVMSMPHFYGASEEYLNQSIGLNPEKKRHEIHILLEPTTAVSMKVSIRIQMNWVLKPIKHFSKLKKIPEMVHPIFWMEQGAALPEDKAMLIKEKLIKTQEIVKLGTYFVIGLGGIAILTAALIYLCRATSVKNTEYNPNKASLEKQVSYEPGKVRIESPVPYQWTKTASPESPPTFPNGRYSIIANSPAQDNPEVQPFLPNSTTDELNSENLSRSSSPRSGPIIIASIPKTQPPNSPYQLKGMDETDFKVRFDQRPRVAPPEFPTAAPRVSNALGTPFPNQNYSSNTSLGRDLSEMDTTLRDIDAALSSYENLRSDKNQS